MKKSDREELTRLIERLYSDREDFAMVYSELKDRSKRWSNKMDQKWMSVYHLYDSLTDELENL
jgi:hypothetical protein